MTPQQRPFYGPWIIAASFITFGLASGLPYYNIAFFYDYLRDDHHWSQQMVTSGAPIAVTQATNANAFAGFGIQRPNLVGDPTLTASERSTSRWFDTSAFAAAPQFTLGSSSRNPVRGPGYRNLDLALTRRLAFRRNAVLELRADVFNVANTPALGAPNGVFGSAAFGSITSAGDPRVVQIAAKILF